MPHAPVLGRPSGPGQSRLRRRSTRATAAATAALIGLALATTATPGPAAATATAKRPVGLPVTTRITLVTGDVALVTTRPGGRRTVALQPNADGTLPQAAITDTGDHLYVVPRDAVPLLSAKWLDLDLFDVVGLMRQHYDDEATGSLPVIVD
jgi:hypothetical protein